jgi:hypothetical protein
MRADNPPNKDCKNSSEFEFLKVLFQLKISQSNLQNAGRFYFEIAKFGGLVAVGHKTFGSP